MAPRAAAVKEDGDRGSLSGSANNKSANGGQPMKREAGGKGCFQWVVTKLKLIDEDATPPNWEYIFLTFVALFASCSTLTFLFPFLPEMILFLGYDETEKGLYGGIIASAVFAGRLFGSMFWGWLADCKGRKLVLLITIALTGIFAGSFGFSSNIYLAVFFRFMCGLVNGVVGTCKAILYDVSDNTNQALAMTMLSLSWGSGLVFGPLMGGLLASPATKWPDVFDADGLFGQFPFLLSSLFPSVVGVAAFFLIFFAFDETLVNDHKRKKMDICSGVEYPKKSLAPSLEMKGEGLPGNDGDTPLLNAPLSNGIHRSTSHLAGSVISLSPEAEMSICLGQDAIEQQSYGDYSDVHFLTKSAPDLMYKSPLKPNSLHSIPMELSKENHSIGDIQQPLSGDVHYLVNEEKGKTNGNIRNQSEVDSPLLISNTNDISSLKHRHFYQRSVSDGAGTQSGSVPVRLDKGKNFIEPQVSEEADDGDEGVCTVKIAAESEEEENICRCADWCCKLACCFMCTNSGFHKLLRLSDVWATIMLYSVFSFVTIALDDIFPVFASTDPDYGGLGFSSSQIGVALGAMTMPVLILQIKLYPYLVRRFGIRKTCLLGGVVCLVCSQLMPLTHLLHDNPTWLWITLLVIQIPLRIMINCCFASTALIINNSVTPDMAGRINGLAMTTTALGRSFAPLVGGALYTWCVKYGPRIGPPFDTSFPYFVLGLLYGVSCIECLFIRPALDKQKK